MFRSLAIAISSSQKPSLVATKESTFCAMTIFSSMQLQLEIFFGSLFFFGQFEMEQFLLRDTKKFSPRVN